MTAEQYKLIERHTSPDDALTLVVFRRDGDWIIGFEKPGSDATESDSGWSWHTHGDLLVHAYGGAPESATRTFVDEVLLSKRVIVVSRVDGVIQEAWVADDPDGDELEYASDDATIEKRFWNGLPYVS